MTSSPVYASISLLLYSDKISWAAVATVGQPCPVPFHQRLSSMAWRPRAGLRVSRAWLLLHGGEPSPRPALLRLGRRPVRIRISLPLYARVAPRQGQLEARRRVWVRVEPGSAAARWHAQFALSFRRAEHGLFRGPRAASLLLWQTPLRVGPAVVLQVAGLVLDDGAFESLFQRIALGQQPPQLPLVALQPVLQQLQQRHRQHAQLLSDVADQNWGREQRGLPCQLLNWNIVWQKYINKEQASNWIWFRRM